MGAERGAAGHGPAERCFLAVLGEARGFRGAWKRGQHRGHYTEDASIVPSCSAPVPSRAFQEFLQLMVVRVSFSALWGVGGHCPGLGRGSDSTGLCGLGTGRLAGRG